jgi:hypothetical protein
LLASLNSTTSVPIIITAVGVGIGTVVTIFLYKDRKMQMKIAFAAFAASILLIFLYFSYVNSKYSEGTYDLTAPILIIIPIFILLAIRAIYKDEKLVKSVDRLR